MLRRHDCLRTALAEPARTSASTVVHLDGGLNATLGRLDISISMAKCFTSLPAEVRRWSTFGPWYAMFPVEFALDAIDYYTRPRDLVVDPFCGRGTSIYAAGALGRRGLGVEINAVGWSYAITKLAPAGLKPVMTRIKEIARCSKYIGLPHLPPFFVKAYSPEVRRFLVCARSELNWRQRKTDRTAMSMILLYAHGNRDNSLSNQMRQTKAMSPEYALRWWNKHAMNPPKLDPVEFLEARLEWRYKHGKPEMSELGNVINGDSSRILPTRRRDLDNWSLLLTSPPYVKIANYHYDQWIRLWLLGGKPHPVVNGGVNQSWFGNRQHYAIMLESVFRELSKSARRGSTVYVRTDARPVTRDITIGVLRRVFPRKRLRVYSQPMLGPSQTDLYNSVDSPGELDITLT